MANGEFGIKKIRREDLPKGHSLCEYCTAKCCHYFAMPIDTPTEFEDFEFIRWYLLHDRATVFTEDEDWYLLVHTRCKHLQPDHRCGIYETRPEICREYEAKDCDYSGKPYGYDELFTHAEQLEAYYTKRTGKTLGTPKRPPARRKRKKRRKKTA